MKKPRGLPACWIARRWVVDHPKNHAFQYWVEPLNKFVERELCALATRLKLSITPDSGPDHDMNWFPVSSSEVLFGLAVVGRVGAARVYLNLITLRWRITGDGVEFDTLTAAYTHALMVGDL